MREKYKEIFLVCLMRCISFAMLITIAIWVFSDYETTDSIIISFPLLLVSPFPNVYPGKTWLAIVYPLFINILIWMPRNKIFNILYIIFTIEKWKCVILLIYSLYSFIGSSYFYPIALREYEYGLLIAIAYYLILTRVFLKYYKEYDDESEHEKQNTVLLVYALISIITIATPHVLPYISNEKPSGILAGKLYDDGETQVWKQEKYVNLSSDRSKLLRSNAEQNINHIEIIDVNTGAKTADFSIENARYAAITHDNNMIVQKIDNENKVDSIELYNLKENKKIKEMRDGNNINMKIENFQFSPNGEFLLTNGWNSLIDGESIFIFDYEKEKLLSKINEKVYNNQVVWVSNNQILFLNDIGDKNTRGIKVEVICVTIDLKKEIKQKKKVLITKLLKKELERLRKGKIFIKSLNEKNKVVIIIQGIPLNGLEPYRSSFLVVDTESENIQYIETENRGIMDIDIAYNKVMAFQVSGRNSVKILSFDIAANEIQEGEEIKKINPDKDFALQWKPLKMIEQGGKMIELDYYPNVWALNNE